MGYRSNILSLNGGQDQHLKTMDAETKRKREREAEKDVKRNRDRERQREMEGEEIEGRATISPSLLIWGDMGELPCPPLMGGGVSISPSSPTQWEGTGYCLSLKGGLILSLLPHMGLVFFAHVSG